MEDGVGFFRRHDVANLRRVHQIRPQCGLARLNVQPDDFAAVPFQFGAEVPADKAQAAGDQRLHAFSLASRFALCRSCSAMSAQSCS